MTTVFALLAGLVVAIHLAFVAFAALGALLAFRRPRVVWVHLPCVAWAAFIELSGRICPLTPLENDLRSMAGLDAYSGDFVARYVFPVLYPEGLTRQAQIVIGLRVRQNANPLHKPLQLLGRVFFILHQCVATSDVVSARFPGDRRAARSPFRRQKCFCDSCSIRAPALPGDLCETHLLNNFEAGLARSFVVSFGTIRASH